MAPVDAAVHLHAGSRPVFRGRACRIYWHIYRMLYRTKDDKSPLDEKNLSETTGKFTAMSTIELSSKELIDSCIRSRIAELEETPLSAQADLPFIVADSTSVLRQHRQWTLFLPQIRPFYGETRPPALTSPAWANATPSC